MRLIAPHVQPGAVHALLTTLCSVPEPVRRYALKHVVFAVLDHRRVRGFAAYERTLGGEWLVVLDGARTAEQILNTAAHELGHVMCSHVVAGEDQEREAADKAASWGFTGSSADADLRAAAFTPTPVPTVRATLTPDSIELECSVCGSPYVVLCPAVAGFGAEVGIGCTWCSTFDVLALRDLVPCESCGQRATVTWAEGASPEHPVATWACACGQSVTREVRELREEQETDCEYLLRRAAKTLHGVENGLRRLEPMADDFDRVAVPLESCRVSIAYARGLVARAAQDLEADSRQALVQGVLTDLAGVGEKLRERDLGAAAGIVGRAAGALDALLTGAGSKG